MIALSRTQQIGLVAIAVVVFAVAVVYPRLAVPAIVIAVACLYVVATSLSKAGQLSRSLSAFQNRPVEIRVWGDRLPGSRGAACHLVSVRAVGPGLHLFVRLGAGAPTDLKIAQPRDAEVGDLVTEIRECAYVQWTGQRIRRVPGAKAVTLTFLAVDSVKPLASDGRTDNADSPSESVSTSAAESSGALRARSEKDTAEASIAPAMETLQPTWHTLADFLIARFPTLRAELEADYYFWSESGDPMPHFFLIDFLVPVLIGQRGPYSREVREEAGRVVDELLTAEDSDLAAAAQTSVFELLRDNQDLRGVAWRYLGPVAKEWLERGAK
jgi:hypothetical protein